MEQAFQYVLKDARALGIAFGQPPGIGFKPQTGLARQIVQAADIVIGPAFGLKHVEKGLLLALTHKPVGHSQLGPQRGYRRGERRVAARLPLGAIGAVGGVEGVGRLVREGLPETHIHFPTHHSRRLYGAKPLKFL